MISDRPLFFLLNSYTTGLQPLVLKDLMNLTLAAGLDGTTEADEIALPVTGGSAGSGTAASSVAGDVSSSKVPSPQHIALPCGASARWNAIY